MYIRTAYAYCWRDDSAAAEPVPSSRPVPPAPAAPLRWARQPWPSKAGPLVAVRLVLGDVQVAVRSGGRLQWMAADKALTPRQARRWVANGF